MLRRISYLLFNTYVFEKSVLRRPRAACLTILCAILLPIIAAAMLFITLPYPWGAVIYIGAIFGVAAAFIFWRAHPDEIQHAWKYLRGNEKDFWIFNKG